MVAKSKIAKAKKGRYTPPLTTMAPVGVDDLYNVPPHVELGRTGLRRFGMFVLDDFLSELQSATRRIAILREMADNDAICGALIFAIKMMCRGIEWWSEAADDSKLSKEAKEFLDQCRDDMEMPWVEVITEALSMLVYGFAFSEITYKQRMGYNQEDPSKKSRYDDGLIGWRKISLRAQTTLYGWQFAEDGSGDVVAMRQLSPPDYKMVDIPITKGLLFRTEATRSNPEGRSILRNSIVAWKFRKNIEVIEGIGIERELAGYPLLRIPSAIINGTDPESLATYAEMQEFVTSIKRDSSMGGILPSDTYENKDGTRTSIPMYDLKLLTSGGSRQIDTNSVITRYNTQILSTILADFISIGHDAIGSKALASSKIDLFTRAVEAYLDVIAETFNRHAIPQLFILNAKFKQENWPRLVHAKVTEADPSIVGNYLRSLKMAGVPIELTQDVLEYLYKVIDLPKPPEDMAEKIEQEKQTQQSLSMASQVGAGPDQYSGFGSSSPFSGFQKEALNTDEKAKNELSKIGPITKKILIDMGYPGLIQKAGTREGALLGWDKRGRKPQGPGTAPHGVGERVVETTRRHEGATFEGGQRAYTALQVPTGISVSEWPERSYIITAPKGVDPKQYLADHHVEVGARVEQWIEKNKDLILGEKKSFGTWIDEKGNFYLDVVSIKPLHQMKEAVRTGFDANQKGIFVIDSKTFIPTMGSGKNREEYMLRKAKPLNSKRDIRDQ